MNSPAETLLIAVLTILGCVLWAATNFGIYFTIHFLLTLPMRRAERARLFLDLIEGALQRGQPVEETLVSASKSRDPILGARFHLVTAWLEKGLRLADAIAKVPRFLSPQIAAMLRAGQRIGDLRKVLPACRQLLRDSVSETRGAVNYLVVLAFVVTPFSMVVFALICIKVMPSLRAVAEGLSMTPNRGLNFIGENWLLIVWGQILLIACLWFVAFLYAAGPRAASWFPFLHRIFFALPWRRKRFHRDFSVMLAILLDSGVSETEAVLLAADCTANKVFQRRAFDVTTRLRAGEKLTEAIRLMDDAGEFRWRLTNATHAKEGFLAALKGWHEALDAKAFQQEQAVAHGITTGFVLLNGLFVGTVVVSVFALLVSVINEGVLW